MGRQAGRHCALSLPTGDLKTLQVLMGHKTIAMTAKYAHLAQRHLAKEIQRIDNLFGGNDGTSDENRADRSHG
jgi:integrase